MISSERLLPISAALLGISSNLRLPYGSKTTESGEWLIWCMIASAHGASMRRSQLGVLMMGGCTVGSGGRRGLADQSKEKCGPRGCGVRLPTQSTDREVTSLANSPLA